MERTKQDRHETPVGVGYNKDRLRHGSLIDNRPLHKRVPETEMQALMEARPGIEPLESLDEIDGSWTAILDCLTDKERSVIELVVIAGMSLAEAGRWLGLEHGRKAYSKQWVAKIRDVALEKMRDATKDME